MKVHWIANFAHLFLIMLIGCQDNGFDLELHMPVEVTRIELTIDQAAGASPRRVSKGVYAVDLDKAGRATISSDWPVARYHRTFLVFRTKRLQKNVDFHVVQSGWRMNKTTERTPQGVTSQTKLDGSVYWMEIKSKPSASP